MYKNINKKYFLRYRRCVRHGRKRISDSTKTEGRFLLDLCNVGQRITFRAPIHLPKNFSIFAIKIESNYINWLIKWFD